MKIKLKLIWRFPFASMIVGAIYFLIKKVPQGLDSWIEWVVIFCLPFAALIVIVLLTLRIHFAKDGITIYWKIGIGPVKLWEQMNYHLNWDQISYAFSQFAIWIPFHLIGVVGHQGHIPRSFFIGSLMTHKKKALVYIGDHAKSAVIGEDLRRLIEKYRRQLNKHKATD